MTKIYQFPSFRLASQLFHVPGQGYDGGLTSGGAQIITPEPGGFGVLELQPAIIDTEWKSPLASWIMSKVNGQVFRVRLAPSPQVAYSKQRGNMSPVLWNNGQTWSNQEAWDGDFTALFASSALKGTVEVQIDLTGVGAILLPGHVFGHGYETYKVDEIEYSGDMAIVTVTPPFRSDIAAGDNCYLRPWFTGRISNGDEMRAAYNHLGHVTPGNIIMHEAIL